MTVRPQFTWPTCHVAAEAAIHQYLLQARTQQQTHWPLPLLLISEIKTDGRTLHCFMTLTAYYADYEINAGKQSEVNLCLQCHIRLCEQSQMLKAKTRCLKTVTSETSAFLHNSDNEIMIMLQWVTSEIMRTAFKALYCHNISQETEAQNAMVKSIKNCCYYYYYY